jgi:hypothetical protein
MNGWYYTSWGLPLGAVLTDYGGFCCEPSAFPRLMAVPQWELWHAVLQHFIRYLFPGLMACTAHQVDICPSGLWWVWHTHVLAGFDHELSGCYGLMVGTRKAGVFPWVLSLVWPAVQWLLIMSVSPGLVLHGLVVALREVCGVWQVVLGLAMNHQVAIG